MRDLRLHNIIIARNVSILFTPKKYDIKKLSYHEKSQETNLVIFQMQLYFNMMCALSTTFNGDSKKEISSLR